MRRTIDTGSGSAIFVKFATTPGAEYDNYATPKNASLTVDANHGVLANDTDPSTSAQPLAAALISGPANGKLSFNPDGSFSYTPNANYLGSDSFTYQDNDGTANSNVATVNITVEEPPTASGDAYSVVVNQPFTIGPSAPVSSLTMQSDPGDWVGGGQSYNLTSANATIQVSANVTTDPNVVGIRVSSPTTGNNFGLSFKAPGTAPLMPGTYSNAARYPFEGPNTPGLDVSGDGRGSNTLTGQFTIVQAVFNASGTVQNFDATFIQHSEGAAPALKGEIRYNFIAPSGVIQNDADPAGLPLKAILVTGPAHGTLTLNLDGTFTYTNDSTFTGADSFTYKVNDGFLDSNVATVTLTAPTQKTTTTVTSSQPQVQYGTSVTLTAAVSAAAGSPNGSVEFYDDTAGADLGAGTRVTTSSTSSTWTLATTAKQLQAIAASHAIHAAFSGQTFFQNSTGTLSGGITVTPLPVGVQGITPHDKTYDGTSAVQLSVGTLSLSGLLSGDQVTVSAGTIAGVFASKDAGSNVPVTLSGLTLGGAQASNYSIAPLAANITPAPVQVSGIAAKNKTYDGTTAAMLDVSGAIIKGVMQGDAVAVSGASGTYASKDVGANVPVIVLTLTLSGANAADYSASLAQPAPTASITPASITVSGIVENKSYDATTSATVTPATAGLVGVLKGDLVTLVQHNPTATFATKTAGSQIVATLTGLSLDGPQALDYVLVPTSTAEIAPAALTVTGATTDNKIYDGTTNAAIHLDHAALNGKFAGDDVHLVTSGATGTFAGKDVGAAIPVAILGMSLSGADAGDYIIAQAATSASITPATLTVSGVAVPSKTYDRTTSATLVTSAAALAGVVPPDLVALDASAATAAYASRDVGTNIAVAVSGLGLTGPQARDYTLTQPTAAGDIIPALLTVTGIRAQNKVYDGTGTAMLITTGASLSGVFAGDNVVLDPSGAVGTFASKDVGTAIPVIVSGLKLSGSQAGDYTLGTSTGDNESWTQYQGNPAHTGAVSAIINPATIAAEWTFDANSLGIGNLSSPVDVGSDVYVTASSSSQNGGLNGNYTVFALDPSTGHPVWNYTHSTFGSAGSAPSVSGNTVYVQFGGHSGVSGGNSTQYPYMVGLDSATGTQRFATSYAAQWGYPNQPTVQGNGVFAAAGYYGGMRGYDAAGGGVLWDAGLPQQTNYIPAADANFVYLYLGPGSASPGPEVATFYAIDRNTGGAELHHSESRGRKLL